MTIHQKTFQFYTFSERPLKITCMTTGSGSYRLFYAIFW